MNEYRRSLENDSMNKCIINLRKKTFFLENDSVDKLVKKMYLIVIFRDLINVEKKTYKNEMKARIVKRIKLKNECYERLLRINLGNGHNSLGKTFYSSP